MHIQELQTLAVEIKTLYSNYDVLNKKNPDTTERILMQFVSDVGDLSRHITRKERGDSIDGFEESIGKELSECLSHILTLADTYGIDIEKSFLKEHARVKGEIEKGN